MEIYLYANLSGEHCAPNAVIAFESRKAVNAYLKAAYEVAALSTRDRNGGHLPKGVETLDEFKVRVWHACVTKSELWTPDHVAKNRRAALDAREERRAKAVALAKLVAEGCAGMPRPDDPVELEEF